MTEITVSSGEELDAVMGSATGPVVVLFTAPAWCGPCRRFEPHWNKAQESPDLADFTFVRIDMGQTPEDTGQHWATDRFNILGVPQIKLMANDGITTITARAVVPLIRELLS